jgi:pimeloyl-ACP methyl ester carboxylesterase
MRVADAKYNQMLMDDDERTNVFLPIYTSHPLNIPTDDITSAVIFIHGGLSDADTYFCHGMNAAYADNSWDDDNEVLVIAPLFGPNQILGNEWQLNATWADDYTYDDTNDDAEDDVSVYFKKECWNRGCDSDSDDTDFTSSFDALDQLIDAISNTSIFPYMERITLAGFSAGGQMLNRYAWASPVGAKTASDSQPNISFIIANAGYHLYLDTYRPAEHCRLEKDTGPGWDCNSYEIPTYPLLDNMSYTPEYPEDDKEETCDGSWSGYHYDISSLPVNRYVNQKQSYGRCPIIYHLI